MPSGKGMRAWCRWLANTTATQTLNLERPFRSRIRCTNGIPYRCYLEDMVHAFIAQVKRFRNSYWCFVAGDTISIYWSRFSACRSNWIRHQYRGAIFQDSLVHSIGVRHDLVLAANVNADMEHGTATTLCGIVFVQVNRQRHNRLSISCR